MEALIDHIPTSVISFSLRHQLVVLRKLIGTSIGPSVMIPKLGRSYLSPRRTVCCSANESRSSQPKLIVQNEHVSWWQSFCCKLTLSQQLIACRTTLHLESHFCVSMTDSKWKVLINWHYHWDTLTATFLEICTAVPTFPVTRKKGWSRNLWIFFICQSTNTQNGDQLFRICHSLQVWALTSPSFLLVDNGALCYPNYTCSGWWKMTPVLSTPQTVTTSFSRFNSWILTIDFELKTYQCQVGNRISWPCWATISSRRVSWSVGGGGGGGWKTPIY